MMPLPRDFHVLGKQLEAWTPPHGRFDPAGAWTLRYVRHALIPERDGAPGGGPAGRLLIEQKPGLAARRLLVTETIATAFSSPTCTADIACANDALLTPQRWSLDIRWEAGKPATIRPGEIDQARSGRAEGTELVFKGTKEHRRPAPERWTSLWNLFAVVPCLPFNAASVLTFDLFEELDLHKPGQRLAYIGQQTFKLKGQPLALHVFEQTGRGVLPWHWWLDEQHRVVLASGGRRAYLLDATAKEGAA